jgi:predicted RND superfamily exporter protein
MPEPEPLPGHTGPLAAPPRWRRRSGAFLGAAALAVALLLGLFVAALGDLETSSSGVHPWFPDGTPERESYLLFDEVFGPEDYWILSLEGEAGEAEFGELARLVREAGELSDPPLIRRTRSSAEFLEGLGPEQAREVRDALGGIFFDKKGERGVVVFESTEHGFRHREEVYSRIVDKVSEGLGEGAVLRLMGPGFVGVMADRETVKTLRRVTPFTFLLSALLAFLMLGDLRRAAIALATSGLSALASITAIHYAGESLSHLLVVVPSLAQLVALSNAVHLLHHYDDALAEDDGTGAPPWWQALSHGATPTVAACLTTMIGFLALLTSSLPVVRSFALFGAAAIMLSMVIVLIAVPAGLVLLRPAPVREGAVRGRLIPALGAWVARRPRTISAALGILFVLAVMGIGSLRTESRTESFFSADSEFKQHLQWFEDEFGYLQASQLMGRFDPGASFADQAAAVARLRDELVSREAPVKLAPSRALHAMGMPGLPPGAEESIRAMAEEEQILVRREDGDYWLVTVFYVAEADPADSPVKAAILEAVGRAEAASGSGEWTLTGTHQLFANAQELLMSELFRSFFLAFALISPLVVLFLRSLRLGLVATVPNLFPIAVFFGLLGHSPLRIDIATMIVASIAFGIAVDNTIHFLTAFSRSRREPGATLEGALAQACARSGAAMVKTTLILAVGMLAFLLSDFGPSRRFAAFTSVVLVLALVGDLVLLPALISGPLKRLFQAGRRAAASGADSSEETVS